MSTLANPVPEVELRDGARLPQLGLGVFLVPPAEAERAVATALESGYRHVDTAAAYRNEAEVGRAVRASGLDRGDIFVTTKLFNTEHAHDAARRAAHESLERLDLGAIDLYLIHWPVPARDLYVETWQALVEMREEGLIRTIGVSNFEPEHLRRLVAETGETPAVNQVELHPYLQQAELRREHAELGILTEAWSPLAQGAVLEDPTIVEIAERHGRTPGQVVIRWHLQLGNVVIPKSVTPARIRENFDVFGFELSSEEMSAIASLDRGERTGPDPQTFTGP